MYVDARVDVLHVLWTGIGPEGADAPWLVYPHAVLSGPVAAKLLQPVTRWHLASRRAP